MIVIHICNRIVNKLLQKDDKIEYNSLALQQHPQNHRTLVRIDEPEHLRQKILEDRRHELEKCVAEAKRKKEQHAGHEYTLIYPFWAVRTEHLHHEKPIRRPTIITDRYGPRLSSKPITFTTPDRKRKFELLTKVLISPWFSLGCGLTVAGSLLAALVVVMGGNAVLVPFLLSTSFLFLLFLLNWKTVTKRVPEMLYELALGKLFTRLFTFSAREYRNYLFEYWIDCDDRILQAQRHIKKYESKFAQGKKLSWNESRKYQLALKDLPQLRKARNEGVVPSKKLAKYKCFLIALSIPLHLVSGFVLGVLTYNLSVTTILQAIGYITGITAAFATPASWIVAISAFLAIITAPTMVGIFIYGSSVYAKTYRPFRKLKHFVLNMFKTEEISEDGQAIKRSYTKKGIAYGVVKSLVITAFLGLILGIDFSQMLGSAYLLNTFFLQNAPLALCYALPAIALVAQWPFYIQQAAKMARGWFRNRLNSFKKPEELINKQIEYTKKLIRGESLGPAKGQLKIKKLKMELAEHQQLQETSAERWHFIIIIPVPGKYWVKMPHWLQNFLEFGLMGKVSTSVKTFLSYWGAVREGSISIPDDGGFVPDAFFDDSIDDFDDVLSGKKATPSLLERSEKQAFTSSSPAKNLDRKFTPNNLRRASYQIDYQDSNYQTGLFYKKLRNRPLTCGNARSTCYDVSMIGRHTQRT